LAAIGLLVLLVIVALVGTGWYVAGLCMHAGSGLPACIGQVRHQLIATQSGAAFQLVFQGILDAVAAFYLLLVLPAIAREPLTRLGFRPLRARDLGIAVVGALVMVVIVNGLGTLLQTLFHSKEQEMAVKLLLLLKSPENKLIAAILAIVVAPIAEELAFRVFVFNFALRRWSFWTAAIVSGVLFGFAHTDQFALAGLATTIPLAIGGIVLCRVYFTSGNAMSSMITHGLFNAVSVVGLFLAPNIVGK
jgi:hypothetical protein